MGGLGLEQRVVRVDDPRLFMCHIWAEKGKTASLLKSASSGYFPPKECRKESIR